MIETIAVLVFGGATAATVLLFGAIFAGLAVGFVREVLGKE